MIPNLAHSQHNLIQNIIFDKKLEINKMANIAEYNEHSIKAILSNFHYYENTKAFPNESGKFRSITFFIFETFCNHLLEKPGLYLKEMAIFLWDQFEVLISTSSISRALKSIFWSKKTTRRIARKQNPNLRNYYLQNLSAFRSYHYRYIDKSGYDKLIEFKRTGWSLLDVTPIQMAKFHRGQHYQILPVYSQNEILLTLLFQGFTNGEVFEGFIEQFFFHCGKWPEPKFVLVINNASFHRSKRIEQICYKTGVKHVYLPLYLPDLNPIEEFFVELKTFIKKSWQAFEDCSEQNFDIFLE